MKEDSKAGMDSKDFKKTYSRLDSKVEPEALGADADTGPALKKKKSLSNILGDHSSNLLGSLLKNKILSVRGAGLFANKLKGKARQNVFTEKQILLIGDCTFSESMRVHQHIRENSYFKRLSTTGGMVSLCASS